MNKDQIKGLIMEVKGEAREVAVLRSGNNNLERKGTIQNVRGKLRLRYCNLREYLVKTM
jgi:uncharacterized protein YjbJ (UPF0337 family)